MILSAIDILDVDREGVENVLILGQSYPNASAYADPWGGMWILIATEEPTKDEIVQFIGEESMAMYYERGAW